jgi:hypothetical protein
MKREKLSSKNLKIAKVKKISKKKLRKICNRHRNQRRKNTLFFSLFPYNNTTGYNPTTRLAKWSGLECDNLIISPNELAYFVASKAIRKERFARLRLEKKDLRNRA